MKYFTISAKFAIFSALIISYCFANVIIPDSLQKFSPPESTPKTIKSLNVDAYLGRWYQMYASLIPNQTFEHNGFCITADYRITNGPNENVAFTVTNSMR